ncbi:MAG: PQQ-binding-like beta-propeller repeat protein [Ferruginibacter sp.]
MKKLGFLILFLFLLITTIQAQQKPFRFAFISDTHIGSPDGKAEEDLRRTVRDINELENIGFVVITGDITELGTYKELRLAKKILDSLHVPWYLIPGNHDTGWSESGGEGFSEIFGYDRFNFVYNNIYFIGCASGPYVRMSDGHVPRDAMNWLKHKLDSVSPGQPVIFLNHYPLDEGLDNWYEVIDELKTHNTILALCGHGHTNRKVEAEGIPAVMGRSNLRAKADEGGYNLVDVAADSIYFTVRFPVSHRERKWYATKNAPVDYATGKKYSRPDYRMNDTNFRVKPIWTFQSKANVISTPLVVAKQVVFGNQAGNIISLDLTTGKEKWSYKTGAAIFSSPATDGKKIVLGSANGYIYCLNLAGNLTWTYKAREAVLGSPLIENNVVYIGASDSSFRALDLTTGKLRWSYNELTGPVVSQPVIRGNTIIFGAWDTHLYALEKSTGKLLWKWDNGKAIRNYSPAACIPVIKDSVVYITAPDRYLTAIHIRTGETLWRTNDDAVRESIGLSEDKNLVFGKTMNDTIVAYETNGSRPIVQWKLNAGYGYEHTPSMLIEKNSRIYFGTRSGVVYALDASQKKVKWKYKIDNSMVNTVNVLPGRKVVAATMNGKLVLLQGY